MLAEGAQAQLDEIEHGAVVDVEDGIRGLLELAVCIKGVGEIVAFLRNAGIGYRDVNMADFDEDLPQAGPVGDIAVGVNDAVIIAVADALVTAAAIVVVAILVNGV